MSNNQTIKSFLFYLFSTIGGGMLIYISELVHFSHLNLAPFGGKSWAVWFHPLSFFLSFVIIGKVMKAKKITTISLVVLIIMMMVFYFVYNEKLFVNPIPFGKG